MSGWISVEDRLPEDSDWYLVYQGEHRFCREYRHDEWLSVKEAKYGDITHWMV